MIKRLIFMFTPVNESKIWDLIERERRQLYEYLASLEPEQWDTASLCDGWKVRDVVAHLVLVFRYTPANAWKDFILSGFRPNRFLAQTARSFGKADEKTLLTAFESIITERRKPASVSVLNVLADLLIHEQDIRVPLGNPRKMPSDVLKEIFTHWEPTKSNLGEKISGVGARVKGIKFILTDLDLTRGEGQEVYGSAQDILLAIAGRIAGPIKLEGDGAETLKSRR